MVIINNISDSEWRLILSALKSYKHDEIFKMIYGVKPKEELDNLIKKIEGFDVVKSPLEELGKMEYSGYEPDKTYSYYKQIK